jgi:GNAT superfamily N-acetyltransferase
MTEASFIFRPISDADYESVAQISQVTQPTVPWSASALRHRDETERTAGLASVRHVVEDGGTHRVIACSELSQNPHQHRPGVFWVNVQVLPAFRRQGLGARLYETVLSEAKERAATCLRAIVAESAKAGLGFAERRGFSERRRVWQSVLDLASVDVGQFDSSERELARTGIEFTTLADEGRENPEVADRLYELELAIAEDIPRMDAFSAPTREQYRRRTLGDPSVVPEAWFIAKAKGRYIGTSYLGRLEARPDTLLQHITGTRPEYRRKGVALALKSRAIRYAQQNHYTSIRTFNDSMNGPMCKLNEKLGFRREETLIQMEKLLG